MQLSIVNQLLELNRQFYSDFGDQFAATRRRIQPGVRAIIARLEGNERILDLGCGNGELARTLAKSGFQGTYLGLDFSLPLLSAAKDQPEQGLISFRSADLSAADWDESLQGTHFSLITAFAVLHHIPGSQLRRRILQQICNLLTPTGIFIHSNWQFLNSERLRNRIQPWEKIGISSTDVDGNDYLLDWRTGGSGLRYVHHFSKQELNQLAAETGFSVKSTYFSDGEGGKLGIYQNWELHENQG